MESNLLSEWQKKPTKEYSEDLDMAIDLAGAFYKVSCISLLVAVVGVRFIQRF